MRKLSSIERDTLQTVDRRWVGSGRLANPLSVNSLQPVVVFNAAKLTHAVARLSTHSSEIFWQSVKIQRIYTETTCSKHRYA